MFPGLMFIVLFMLNRCIIGGHISFKEKLYQHNILCSVRPLAGDPNNFSSGVECFDISDPMFKLIFDIIEKLQ